MKDFIVLIATVILGIALASLVLGLKGSAQKIFDKTVKEIDDVFSYEMVLTYETDYGISC